MAFSRFQSDDALRGLVKKNRDPFSFSDDGAEQGEKWLRRRVTYRRRFRIDRRRIDSRGRAP
jgi:hypothetical protein